MTATGLVEVVFAAATAAQGTPLWWLAERGVTNEFDLAEAADPDEDGMPTWREYLANTDPTNGQSLLQFEVVQPDPDAGATVLRWQSASNRAYSIWRSVRLPDGFAERIATNVPATPPANVYTAAVAGLSNAFFRIELDP